MRATVSPRRGGFTLVELMVAAAVCVLIMAILASAFQSGIDTLRHLRSMGELQDQLRAAGSTIKRDLQAPHFLAEDGKPNRGVRLSDQRLDALPASLNTVGPKSYYNGPYGLTQGGFVRIVSPPNPERVIPGPAPALPAGLQYAAYEGADGDGLESYRCVSHSIHFTSILPGGADQNLFAGSFRMDNLSAPVTATSRVSEVAFLLVSDPNAARTGTGGNAVPLYNLVRRQRLAALSDADVSTLEPIPKIPGPTILPQYVVENFQLLSRRATAGAVVNSLGSLVDPNNRLGGLGLPGTVPTATPSYPVPPPSLTSLGSSQLGDDVLLSNVISFEVKASHSAAAPFYDPTKLPALVAFNTDFPFDFLPKGNNPVLPYTFDTWGPLPNWNQVAGANPTPNNVLPNPVRVRAVQVRIRVYDPKMKAARQMTIVVDL